MLSQLEQACKTYSTDSSSGLIELDRNWQRIICYRPDIFLDRAISDRTDSLISTLLKIFKGPLLRSK